MGGRFKETKLFSEQKKRIGVFYLKSCRPSIFSLICERESDQNNRITGKITKISAGICRKWFSDWEKKPFHPFSLLLSRWHFNGKILLIFCEFLRPILAWQEQRKWCLVFFHQEGHSALFQKLPDKAMSIWNLHKKFQLSSAMGLRDFDLQSQPTLMGGNPLIVVHWTNVTHKNNVICSFYYPANMQKWKENVSKWK